MPNLLRLRKRMKKRKPEFKRQEYFKHKRLGNKWRRPKGRHSKLRIKGRCRGRVPKPSYSSPKAVRGLDRYGYKEVRVFNPGELGSIDPGKEAVVIGGSVGKAKREAIKKKAKDLKLRVSNL